MKITVFYSAADGAKITRTFKTLTGAQKFAHKWVGAYPEISPRYAVSGDGVGKITVDGAMLRDLFPPMTIQQACEQADDDDYDRGAPDPDKAYERYLETRYEGLDSVEAIAFGRWEDA